jgi:hypothetical protein
MTARGREPIFDGESTSVFDISMNWVERPGVAEASHIDWQGDGDRCSRTTKRQAEAEAG